MRTLGTTLKLLRALIYVCYIVIVLYFPAGEILSYAGRETRMFKFTSFVAIQDVILPALALAILYAGVGAIQRRIQPKSLTEDV